MLSQANQANYGIDANAGDAFDSTCSNCALANEHPDDPSMDPATSTAPPP